MSVERELSLHPFGRYWPVRLLAVGGMAEIYLTRQAEPAGPGGVPAFDKDVVVKRLKPDLARDPTAAAMFRDEARISAALSHPYVVQVFDVGQDEGTPFIAMEYIRGEELNQLCRRGLAAGAFLPLRHAVELCRQAAMALGYIHALRDADGHSLEIVHCDVSPTNFLVTEDGFLKVIDFGIARARGQARQDRHVMPGKLSYMSPEQARRQVLDHRSDIFSLGVVLYEITLGQRLFKGPAQEVFDRLVRCDIKPPTFVRREFPGMLESIIMRALEPEPAERYASAFDMADELEEFLRESQLASGPLRIARYLDQLALAGGGQRRPELVPEHEDDGDDEALDFDRGLFEGYQAASPESAARAAEWDEFDEPDQAVADALGVDLGLVKSAGLPVDGAGTTRPPAEGGGHADRTDRGASPGAGPGQGPPPGPVRGAALHRAPTAPPAPREPVAVGARPRWIVIAFLIGLAAGAAGLGLLRLLLG